MRKEKVKETLMGSKQLREKINKEYGKSLNNHEELIDLLSTQCRKVYKHGDPVGKKVNAFVDFGRWVGACECGGAEIVDKDNPIFFCCSCGNKSTGGLPRPVQFPKEINEIEKELLSRKDNGAKCWHGESIKQLIEEGANGV